MNKAIHKQLGRQRRHARIRARVKGTADCPRLAVFRSNRYIYAQLINDDESKTVVSADSRTMPEASAVDRATAVGAAIAEAAKAKKITKVVFDRGGFQYQGAVAAVADGARNGGLSF